MRPGRDLRRLPLVNLAVAVAYLLVLLAIALFREERATAAMTPASTPTRPDELPGREPDDRLYTGTCPLNPLGLSRGGRPMMWSRTDSTTRVAVQHHAPDLRPFRLRAFDPWRREPSVRVSPGLTAHGANLASLEAPAARLRSVLPTLGRLLPAGRRDRLVEVSSAGVTLVVEDPLTEAECAEVGQALEAITEALLREPGAAPLPWHAVARVEGPTRCAYCHDDLGAASARCPGCATALHAECAAELRRCPTAGCDERRRAA